MGWVWVRFGLGLGWVWVGFRLGLGWVWVGFGLCLGWFQAVEKFKISFGVQKWTFGCCFQVKMIFKNILEVPGLIPAQFSYKTILFFKQK